ncbi:MAG: sensor histidine kinase [Bacteroidota bacterium]
MKWGLFIFLACTLLCLSCDSPTESSSAISTVKNDSISLWISWAQDSAALGKADKTALLNKAYNKTLQLQQGSYKTQKLADISYANLLLKDSINFKKANALLLKEAKLTQDHYAHGMAHWDLADFHKNKQQDSSYYHFREAYQQFILSDLEGEKQDYPGRMLLAMAAIKEDIKDYVGAEKEAIKAIEIFKQYDSDERLSKAYDVLATIQSGLNKFDKALEYYDRSASYFDGIPKEDWFEFKTRNLNNVASTYLRSGDFQKALEMFHSLENVDSLFEKRPKLYAKALTSKAYSDFKKGDNNFENHLRQIEYSTRILDSLGANYESARNFKYAAEVYAKSGDTVNALESGKQAVKIAKETENNDRLLTSLELLTTLDKQNAAAHAKAYFDLNEKLQLQERNIQDKFARIQMETDEIIEEKEFLERRTALLGGIAMGLLVLGVGIFTIISQRISNQRLKFKQKQQESNQEIYNLMLAQHGKLEEGKKSEQKRVSEELHDGILGQMLGIRLVLSGLNERTDATAIEQREELIGKLQELEEEIRTISHELNAAAYQKVHNFIISVKELIQNVQRSSGIITTFDYEEDFDWDRLKGDIKINTYRIVQELLQNCVKHANCKTITVSFTKDKNVLHLNVADDGVGFESAKGKRGIGLKNIISRVKKLNATLEFDSAPGKGTVVGITIPNIDLHKENPKVKDLRTTMLKA